MFLFNIFEINLFLPSRISIILTHFKLVFHFYTTWKHHNLKVFCCFLGVHSKVSNRRGAWNSRDGWKKYQKLIVGGLEYLGGGGGGGGKKFKNRGGGGCLLNCFLLSFSNHENYSIKNICEYSKSKIKTKNKTENNLRW